MNASTDRIYNDVLFLTSIKPARNYRNVHSLRKVVAYIQDEFQKTGATPQLQRWRAAGNTYENVIASYQTEKKRRLVVGAHYDVAGTQPGADDNASGVAGLLELSRLVFEHKPGIDYRIDFVAYCLEEPPFFGSDQMGSYIHAKSLHNDNADVIGMISLEMIGYFSDEPNSQTYPSPELAAVYPSTANFIVVVGLRSYEAFNNHVHGLMSTGSKIDVHVVSFPPEDALASLAALSDQRSYWQFDYPALMINDTSFVRNPNYHKASDTIDTLDFPKMSEVVNSTYRAVVGF